MSEYSVSQTPPRYRLNDLRGPRHTLPPPSAIPLTEGLLFGLAGGAILAIPVALRAPATFGQALLVWLGATGLGGMLLGLFAAALRLSRPLPRRSPALLLGLGFAIGPLALLGTILHHGTHHRPLGAATYAVGAAMVIALSWALGGRTWLSIRSPFPRRRSFGYVLLALGCGASLLGLLPTLLSWLKHFTELGLFSYAIIDGLLGLALGLIGGFARFPKVLESIARIAGPLAFGICALSFALALQSTAAPLLGQASLLWAWLG